MRKVIMTRSNRRSLEIFRSSLAKLVLEEPDALCPHQAIHTPFSQTLALSCALVSKVTKDNST